MNRIRYFDTLKFFAAFIVFATHFIASYHREYFELWNTFPTSLILKGVTGKLGVAFFSVVLGYFAYLSKEKDATLYFIKRYSFFAIGAFIINSLYYVRSLIIPEYDKISIIKVIYESIILGDGIFSTYWCVQFFVIASIISYLNGRANITSIGILVEIVLFLFTGNYWISICLMGNLIARYKINTCVDIFKYRIIRIILWIVIFFAIKRTEATTTYVIYGICCTVMILLIMRGGIVKKALDNKILSSIGERCMAIYIIHAFCYSLIAPILFRLFEFISYDLRFFIVMAICFIIIVLISYPLTTVMNKLTNLTIKIFTMFNERIVKKYI